MVESDRGGPRPWWRDTREFRLREVGVEFLILGPLKLVGDDGPIAVNGHGQRTVLAVLLANSGQVIPLDYLIDAIWDDRPPTTAKRQVQNYVSAIRRALAGGTQKSAGRTTIVSDGHGYRIRPRPGELDAQVFADQVAHAHELVSRGQPEAAATQLRSALRLWRGPALLGVTGRAVEAAAARLDEQRLAAVEGCLDLELSLGRHHELVGELAELVAAHPLRERLVGQLMLARHGSGRQSEALATYHQLRDRLGDELGLDPSTALQQLHAAILRNDPALRPRSGSTVPGSAVPGRAVGNAAPSTPAQLPADVASFTGRAEYLKRLDELLDEPTGREAHTVVISAIAGMAGVGKTALAVRWGHRVRDRFPDGQLYVNLGGYSAKAPVRPIEALAHFLGSLGEPAEQIPTDVQTAAGRFRTLLAGKRMLVLLDNAASADQVRPLLPAHPGCLVLVTSRDRLTGLLARDGAGSLTLDVLTPDEAHTLLARILRPERVAAEPEATTELAQVCSHLPLALRVAAANLVNHPWPSIAGYVRALREGDRLAALEVEGDEQTGVRRAFDLSYQTLHADSRRVFRLLALVPGPDVTGEAAAALAAVTTTHAQQQLGRLAAAHLVSQRAPGRYTCHDLLRSYAAQLAQDEETEAARQAARQRLYDWYLRCADAAAKVLYPHPLRLPSPVVEASAPAILDSDASALGWLDAERANLVAAIGHAADHGARSVAWLLTDTLRGYFWLRMHIVDWEYAAHTALAAAERDDDLPAQAAALLSIGDFHFRQSQYQPASQRYTAALALAERAGWAECQAAALANVGVVHRESGRLRPAAEHLDRALTLYRTSGSRYGEAITLDSLGRVYLQLGRLAEATDCCTHALRINHEIGSRLGEAATLGDLGDILHAQGRLDEATDRFTRALTLFRELGDRTNEADMLRSLAAVRCDRGDLDEAAGLVHAARALAHELGDRRVQAQALITLGAIDHRLGRHRESAELHRQALDLAQATGDQHPQAAALVGLADAHRCLGHRDLALERAGQALVIARRAGYGLLEERALTIVQHLQAPPTSGKRGASGR